MSVSDAVLEGRLAGLKSLRDALAREIDEGPVGEKAVSQTAALARQLREVLRDIEAIEQASGKGSAVDDLAQRRKSRRAGTSGSGEAAGGSR